jgi:Flp pilus assembly protein TadD
MKGSSGPPGRGAPVRSRRAGRRWAALAIASCIIASASGAGAQSLWDDPAFALYRQAVDALNNKDYAGADRLAAEAIQQYPNHVLAHYLRGRAALAQSKWSEAVAALAKVTELYPGSFAGQRDLGIAYQHLGRPDDATRAYGVALKLRPEDEDLRVRMALMLLQTGQAARALSDLQQLAQQDTKIPEVWTALGRAAYEKGDFAAAEKSFTRALALRDDGNTWFNLGVVRVRLGNRVGALGAFERAATHPESKEQAVAEIDRLKTSAREDRPARGLQPAPSPPPSRPPRQPQ